MANVNDAHGSETLTNTNTVTFVTGKVGNGASFASASNQRLSRTSNANLQTGDIDFTITCWVNFTTLATSGLVGKGAGGAAGTNEYTVYYDGAASKLAFSVGSGAGGTFTAVTDNVTGALSTGTWYFVAARHDATANTISIGVNAGTVTSTSHSAGVQAGSNALELGRRYQSNSEDLNGLLDEAAFWKRALSDAEITDLYNGGSGRDYSYVSTAGAAGHPTMRRWGGVPGVTPGQRRIGRTW